MKENTTQNLHGQFALVLKNKHHTAHTTIACIQKSLNSHDGHYQTQSSQELKLIKQEENAINAL